MYENLKDGVEFRSKSIRKGNPTPKPIAVLDPPFNIKMICK
jgi:hypothetical protein